MKFGETALADAHGAILAHSVKHDGGTFKKGRVLSAGDIEALSASGVTSVIAARLEAGDIAEDAAAERISQSAAGEGCTVTAPFTGRANLYAQAHGLALIDEARVAALNGLHESVTIATLPAYAQVAPRQMLATVKIIPFAAPSDVVNEAAGICATGEPLVSVAPFAARDVGLVLTRLPQTADKLIAKSTRTLSDRIEALGSQVTQVIECGHDAAAVANAIEALRAFGCDLVLVLGASAIVDRGDVIPQGLERAGGEVVHLGMPVDPGNLLMLGHAGAVPVIGVPSCARSPKLNGFDWVLQRLAAGLEVSGADIAAMGAGGLLKEIPSRPTPRDAQGQLAGSGRAPRVAALVLAAGQSRRMGPDNKLLEPIGGVPMVRAVVENVGRAQVAQVTAVLGHEPDEVRAALDGLSVSFVQNADYGKGLSTSLKAGLDALPGDIDAVLVCLGDMPFVEAQHLNKLIAAFDPQEGRGICVPVFNGKRGNPVLWGRAYFDEMRAVQGDVGARHLLGQFEEDLCEVETGADAVMTDIDTPEALAKARSE